MILIPLLTLTQTWGQFQKVGLAKQLVNLLLFDRASSQISLHAQ